MLSKLSVKRPYTVVVGVVLIIILGIVSFQNMTVDLLPSMNLPYAIVATTYAGASPEEVEEVVTKPVEQTMATVSNIKTVQSISSENASTVILEFDQTANMDAVTIEMRESLDQIQGLWPDAVSNPIIMKLNPDMMPVLITAVSAKGQDAGSTSQLIQDEVIPEIESVEGVASVGVSGSVEEMVEVTLHEEQITQLNADMKAEMEAKINEAKSALEEAKSQVENGRAALEIGQQQAAAGLSEAEAQVAVKSEEIRQAQLEISEKMAELHVAETQISQSLAIAQSAKAAAEAQITELATAKESYEQIVAALQNPNLTEEERANLEAQKAKLQPVMDNYDSLYATAQAALSQADATVQTLTENMSQITQGKSQLENLKTQVNSGAMTLAQARGELASAQLEAATGLGQAQASLSAGEMAVQMQEAQAQAAGSEADLAADGMGDLL